MMAQYLERIDGKYRPVVEEMNRLPSLKTFFSTIGKGKSNEDEFAKLATDIYALLLSSSLPLPKPEIRYVYSGQHPMRHRTAAHPWMAGHESSSNRFNLKPDFFTAWVRGHEGKHEPESLSAKLFGNKTTMLPRRSDRLPANETSPEIIRNNKNVFAWDDINVLLEIKSIWNAKNEQDILSNLVLKATEVFRFQWQRRYVLGISVCGSRVRIVRCERSGVFLGQALEAEDALVQCILASLVPGDSGIAPPNESMFVQLDGTVCLEVQVGGDKFILGDQIVGPQRDHLVGRATAVHLARRHTDTTWTCCFKTAWPCAVRPHEGEVLETLQGVTGVVRLLGWDVPKTEGDLDAHHIHRDYKLLDISSKSPLKTLTAGGDIEIASATKAEALKTNGLNCFDSRQYRQTVTECIKDSFDTFRFHDPIDRLYAWLDLYKVVNAIAIKGFVHRDLSWSNVRLFRPQQDSPPSVTIIDFDLASIIEGFSSGSPDKTGTVTFMPIEVLLSPSGRAFRHQELHEDEAAFWIGFLAIINCSESGSKVINSLMDYSLDVSGQMKGAMLLPPAQKIHWPSWFAPQGDANTIIRDLCLQLIELQFKSTGDHLYPDVGDKDENGVRRQKKRHEMVFQKIVEEFEKRIGQLKKLQGIGDGQVESLTEGTQSLQM